MERREGRVRELREALSSLDQEHDSLRRETDGKDETIQQLQEQLTEKVRTQLLIPPYKVNIFTNWFILIGSTTF